MSQDEDAPEPVELADVPELADLPELARAVGDASSVRRVFGEAYERDGVLVVPVAKVVGLHALARAAGGGRYGFRAGRPGGPDRPGAPEDAGLPTQDAGTPEDAAPAEGADAGARRGPWGRGPFGHGWAGPGGGHGPHPHGGPGHAHGRGRGRGWADAGSAASRTKPLGVYVVDDEGVHWRPALDLNRVILGGQLVGAVSVLALAWALGRHRRR